MKQKVGVMKSTAPLPRTGNEMSVTARAILDAAKKIVLEDGFAELTFDAIARESGANRASIPYHFGNKAGLLTAMVDSFLETQHQQLLEGVRIASLDRKLSTYIEGKQRISGDTDAFTAYYEVLPYMLRTEALRHRLSDMYSSFADRNREGLAVVAGLEDDSVLHRLDALMVAVADGVGLQMCLDPARFPAAEAYSVLEEMLKLWLEKLTAETEDPQHSEGTAPTRQQPEPDPPR